MSSKPRKFHQIVTIASLIVATSALAACGFKPLYGHNGAAATASDQVQSQLATISVDKIPNRSGQLMRTALKRRLTPRGQSADQYHLSVLLSEGLTELAVEQNAFATRANLILKADFSLIRVADGSQVTQAAVKQVASYNILTSDFATLSAQQDARERAIEALADSIRTRLAIYFNGPGKQAVQPQPSTTPYAVR